MLNGFHDGMETSSVWYRFFSKIFAIVDLVNAHHASEWHIIRFILTISIKTYSILMANKWKFIGSNCEKNDAFRKVFLKIILSENYI